MVRVAVVDDDVLVLSMMRRTLQLYGFDVECHNGAAAFFWHLDGRRLPDVVFCDVMMPVEDGIALYRKLVDQAGSRMPEFVFMTAMEPGEELRRILRENPSVQLLRKPFSLHEVKHVLSGIQLRSPEPEFVPA